MKKRLALVILIFAAFSVVAFAQKVTNGKIVKGVYKNKYLGLELPVPESWVVQNKEQVAQLTNMGKQMLSDDKNLKKVVDATNFEDAYLLTLFKYELGTPGEYNPSLFLIATDIEAFTGIKTGKDFLLHVGKMLLASGMDYDIEDEFEKQRIGTKDFYVLTAALTVADKTLHQQFFSTVLKGHAVGFSLTWGTDEQKEELYDIINKIKI